MKTPMTSKERVLAAARRQVPDRIPRIVPLESAVAQKLKTHLGKVDLTSALKVDLVWVGVIPTALEHDYSHYFTRPGVTWDEWGRGRIWDSEAHYAEYLYPLERAETVDEILAFPWPDLAENYRYQALETQVQRLHSGNLAVVGALAETVFEIAWQLRSMDRLFEDILGQDEKAAVLLDHITDRRVAVAQAYARAGVDLIEVGDDVAMQDRLLMSRKMWNRWFRPRLERIIQAARSINPDILIWYHSDGKINDLVPDLIDAGVDILNPVQPECVEHAWIKRTYGDRLAFSGGLGVQSVLPFGTPAEVREHVRQTILTLGANGGLIIGPSHVIERDTSLDNIFAMLAAIDEFGGYQ
jgi:uroporphyrinogen decarboxylase